MANVLTTDSTISCGHKGELSKESHTKLMVGGNPVLVRGSIESTFSTCPLKDNTNTGTVQCKKATITGGEANKLKAGGSPVMLDTIGGSTDGGAPPPTPPTPIIVVARQSKLQAQ